MTDTSRSSDHNGPEQTFRDTERNLRDRIEALEAENERLREALSPFALAAEKGFNVYVGVKQAMANNPYLFSYSTAYVDAGRSAAHSHISWNDYEEARAALAARDLKIVETEMQEKLR